MHNHRSPLLPPEWRKCIDISIDAAVAATDAIMEVYGRDFSVEYKADNSPLTEADRASHDCIVRHLKPTGIPVVSEEDEDPAYDVRTHWPMQWLVDPLDGTKEFVKRNGDFTVNIALVVDGRPMMGVVLAPVTGELFVGVVGKGAGKGLKGEWEKGRRSDDVFAGMERLSVGKPTGSVVRMVMSKSHLNPETLAFVERWKQEGVAVETVSRGSSMKLCLVAAGAADVYPRLGPTMEWDTAAAQAVVEAAGGRVLIFDDAMHTAYQKNGPAAFAAGTSLTYNKPNRLNPCFVVTSAGRI